MSILPILLLSVALLVFGYFFGGNLPRPYRDRVCQGRQWKRQFPNASKEEIRSFLTLFMQAFAFNVDDGLKLKPDDLPIDIYRKLYPSKWTPDALELETLASDFERTYRLRLEEIWNEGLTLGDLFAHSLRRGV